MEVFNSGFTSDSFRIDVLERSKAIIQVYDNETGQRILEDDDDGTFHTNSLDRHNTQTIRLSIKPSGDRADPDMGMIRLEVASMNNSSLKTIVEFTIKGHSESGQKSRRTAMASHLGSLRRMTVRRHP